MGEILVLSKFLLVFPGRRLAMGGALLGGSKHGSTRLGDWDWESIESRRNMVSRGSGIDRIQLSRGRCQFAIQPIGV